MDPFSITLGVVTLVTVASKVGIELKRLRNGAHEASTSINAMLADLKALKIVLESIEEGFEDLDGRAPLTGYIGAHWSALRTSLSDGCESMDKLRAFLELTNKEVKLLDPIRRTIRLKEANERIVTYRQEIQAYKDALQLSLQSVIFFQQTTIEDNTSKLLSSSHDLQEDLDRLAKSINVRLMALEMAFKGQSGSTGTGAASVEHLRDCVRTAATVVTSASTVLDEGNENAWGVTSEFGWLELNTPAQNDLTLSWIESQSTEELDSQWVGRNNTSGESRPSSPPPSATSAPPTTVVTRLVKSPESRLVKSPESRLVKSPESRHHEAENAAASEEVVVKPTTKKRRNFSVSRLLSPRPKEAAQNMPKSPMADLLCMDNTCEVSDAGKVTVKFTFVGDGASGKTCFLIAASTGVFPTIYNPTVFDVYATDCCIDGIDFKCGLFDNAGQEDYDQLRPLAYPSTDVYFICFAIDTRWSFDNVIEKWLPEIKRYGRPNDPIVLLGFKKDLRYDPITIERLSKMNRKVVTAEEGENRSKEIGAVKYFECSAITREGVSEIFPTVLSMIVEHSPGLRERYKSGEWRPKRKRRIFGKGKTK